MSIARSFLLVSICISLFAGGMANAAVPCCVGTPEAQTQMDDGTDMPCHKTADSKKAPADCKGCDCQHCLQMSMMPSLFKAPDAQNITTSIEFQQHLYSRHAERIHQPPRFIS